MHFQKQIALDAQSRGFHLVTGAVVAQLPELSAVEGGVLHLFLRHTSASLTLNENADPSVRRDMEQYFLHAVSDDTPYFEHTLEGPDDMPAHVKSSMLGASVSVPVQAGRLLLGIWQGIWLGEHRHHGGRRCIVATCY